MGEMPKVTFKSPSTDFGLFGVSGVLGGQHFLYTTGQSGITDLQEHRLNSVVGKLHNSDERHMAMTAFFQLSLSIALISRASTVIEDRCCQKQLDQRCTQKSQRQKPPCIHYVKHDSLSPMVFAVSQFTALVPTR